MREPLSRALLLLLAPAALLLAACSAGDRIEDGPQYPAALKQSAVANVQVQRKVTEISFVNSTPRALGPGRMWLNQWYSREIGAIKPGEETTLSLWEFKDRYGEKYRAGGFFAIEHPEKLVLVQVEQEGSLIGLITVSDGAEGY